MKAINDWQAGEENLLNEIASLKIEDNQAARMRGLENQPSKSTFRNLK